jgi:hypothetical protein
MKNKRKNKKICYDCLGQDCPFHFKTYCPVYTKPQHIINSNNDEDNFEIINNDMEDDI